MSAPSAALTEEDEHWRSLIGQIGSDVGAALTGALERVTTLATTGKIDRTSLRALRDEIELARRAGMIGQQLARYASGRIRQSPEQISLTLLLREVLLQRGREASVRHLDLRQSLRPVEVVADATLLHALAQALVDWVLEHARESVEFRIELKSWPAHARLLCRFGHDHDLTASVAEVPDQDHNPAIDSMSWRLVQQLARTLRLEIQRLDAADRTELVLEFPHTVSEQQIEGVSAVEIDQGFGFSENSKPLAGSHVLVIAARRDLRGDVRDATRHMGLLVDFVNSVDEAEVFCRDALPHAIVYESALAGERFARLRTSILAEVPSIVFIEISEEGKAFEMAGESGRHHALVGRDSVLESLPSALLFELSRSA